MKRIILDVDGVSADFVTHSLRTLVALGGPQMQHDDIRTWDIFGSIPREWEDRMVAEWHRPGWCAGIPLYDGARDAVMALREAAEVVFVTTAMEDAPHWMWERDRWLRQHLNAGARDTIFAASKKHIWGDVFVDDKASNVAEWHRAHPASTAVLWDQPYNRSEKMPEGVVRTRSWEQVVQLVSRSA